MLSKTLNPLKYLKNLQKKKLWVFFVFASKGETLSAHGHQMAAAAASASVNTSSLTLQSHLIPPTNGGKWSDDAEGDGKNGVPVAPVQETTSVSAPQPPHFVLSDVDIENKPYPAIYPGKSLCMHWATKGFCSLGGGRDCHFWHPIICLKDAKGQKFRLCRFNRDGVCNRDRDISGVNNSHHLKTFAHPTRENFEAIVLAYMNLMKIDTTKYMGWKKDAKPKKDKPTTFKKPPVHQPRAMDATDIRRLMNVKTNNTDHKQLNAAKEPEGEMQPKDAPQLVMMLSHQLERVRMEQRMEQQVQAQAEREKMLVAQNAELQAQMKQQSQIFNDQTKNVMDMLKILHGQMRGGNNATDLQMIHPQQQMYRSAPTYVPAYHAQTYMTPAPVQKSGMTLGLNDAFSVAAAAAGLSPLYPASSSASANQASNANADV